MKTLLLLAVFVLFAASHAAPQTTAVVPEYDYNITVVVPQDDNRNQEGKIWVILEGKNNGEPFQHEIKLTPHSTPIRPGNSYQFLYKAPYPIEKIESALVYWKAKTWAWSNPGGFLNDKLHVRQVIFEPTYVTGTLRASATKKFCSTQDPVVMESEVKYKFFVSCN